jgi:hypothetical protein
VQPRAIEDQPGAIRAQLTSPLLESRSPIEKVGVWWGVEVSQEEVGVGDALRGFADRAFVRGDVDPRILRKPQQR